ncbi:hypothetical protein PPTG_16124 [Phytophthora nicotianae INRA-310]|uniref:DUF7869 domain-containing protein n=1 Tax=Phytophthora nicotianae (strain INRA-310) TaxID=761204 RepID=W2PQ77_PHYN3|nr:hypothetical protein PPTG_16124 [Phytophthora nicotianae INRA-310]ETN03153.1 hypothetical protein PPTG_16124 [Phytophthora nicotianae INRA-310]
MLRQLPPPPSPALESLTPEQPPSNDLASNGELPLTAMSSSLATEASPVVEIQLAQDTNEIEVASIQEPASVDESEEGESDEPDDSNDEDWSDVNGSTVEDEVLTGESETEEEEVDISIILENVDVHQIVVDLIRDDQCERRCLEGKAGGTQTNYVYDEFTSGKGSDQINSMLQHFIRTVLVPAGKKHLMVYADNCSGQNKNNHVIKFFLAQVQRGTFERVDYKFFVKGHTKNSCDRGFGHIRKHISRSDCWTMDHVISAVKDAAASNRTVHISRGNDFFKSYKPLLQELYKTLAGVQQYQIFSMIMEKPGVVLCKKGPDDAPVEKDLRRIVDGVLTENEKVVRMMDHFLEDLPVRPKNTEKIAEFYKNIRPYVPDEYQSDPLYAAPSKEQGEEAKSAKQARREHRAAMAVAAKANQDRRNRDAEEAVCPMPKRSRK